MKGGLDTEAIGGLLPCMNVSVDRQDRRNCLALEAPQINGSPCHGRHEVGSDLISLVAGLLWAGHGNREDAMLRRWAP